MAPGSPRAGSAVAMALSAGFIWASYYIFVDEASPAAGPAALLALPFLFAGAAYALYAVVQGHGRALLRMVRSPIAYLRVLLLLAMQLSVLAITFLAGAVDAALLSLVGDVVFTPILLMAFYREGTDKIRSGFFLLGLALCVAGAALTIVGGGAARPLSLEAWLVAPVEPVAIGAYFVLMARESRTTPVSAVVAQSTLTGGLLALPLSLVLPGGFGGYLFSVDPTLLLLVALGLTSFFLGPALYFEAIERAGLILPAVLMSSIPVFTLLLSVALLHYSPPVIALLGIPIAVAGSVLALRGEHAPWAPDYSATT